MQYPATKQLDFSTYTVQYLNGSEQRFRMYARPLHRWVVNLDLLDEEELHRLREFFRSKQGAAGPFTFTDPWDGISYSSCSIEGDVVVETLVGESNGKTSLVIREQRI